MILTLMSFVLSRGDSTEHDFTLITRALHICTELFRQNLTKSEKEISLRQYLLSYTVQKNVIHNISRRLMFFKERVGPTLDTPGFAMFVPGGDAVLLLQKCLAFLKKSNKSAP